MKKSVGRWLLAASIGIICLSFGTALAQHSYVYSMVNNVEIRTGPGAEYQIIDKVNVGTMLEVTGEDTNADWLSVKTIKGSVGWVLKGSITYERSPATFSDSQKGIADVEVAKQQAAKWWESRNTSATPVCDICNIVVPRNTGYLLSTREVLGSKAYHEMFKASFPDQYSTLIARFQQDKTPWLICQNCIDKYFINVPGVSNPDEIEKAMLSDKALNDNILRAAKQYSIAYIRDKVNKNELWLLEDNERNAIYPITPLSGKELLQSLEKEQN